MADKLQIKWRPSGGRGEYEYITTVDVEGRALHLRVPILGSIIITDVRFRVLDGKPRLRREDPNDRSVLNVPPLVAAMCALPLPRRSLTAEIDPHVFNPDSFVVDTIDCIVRDQDNVRVLLEPVSLLPRGMDSSHEIDVAGRLSELAANEATHPAIRELLGHLRSGASEASLADLATEAFDDFRPPAELGSLGAKIEELPAASEESDQALEYLGKEGKERFILHRKKERDRKLVRVAKLNFKLRYGKLFCESCGLCFEEFYGPLGAEFIEAHHRLPLGKVTEETAVSPTDLAMLCANCHRMIHREAGTDVSDLAKLVASRGKIVSAANLALLAAEPSE